MCLRTQACTLTHICSDLLRITRFISVHNRDVLVRISRPPGGTWTDAGVEVERALAEAVPSSHVSGLCGRVRRSNGESVRGVVQEMVESVRRLPFYLDDMHDGLFPT